MKRLGRNILVILYYFVFVVIILILLFFFFPETLESTFALYRYQKNGARQKGKKSEITPSTPWHIHFRCANAFNKEKPCFVRFSQDFTAQDAKEAIGRIFVKIF